MTCSIREDAVQRKMREKRKILFSSTIKKIQSKNKTRLTEQPEDSNLFPIKTQERKPTSRLRLSIFGLSVFDLSVSNLLIYVPEYLVRSLRQAVYWCIIIRWQRARYTYIYTPPPPSPSIRWPSHIRSQLASSQCARDKKDFQTHDTGVARQPDSKEKKGRKREETFGRWNEQERKDQGDGDIVKTAERRRGWETRWTYWRTSKQKVGRPWRREELQLNDSITLLCWGRTKCRTAEATRTKREKKQRKENRSGGVVVVL